MKNITIAGRVSRDAETRNTQNGDQVTGFSVAVDHGFGENKRAIFFDVSMWGRRGASVAPYLTKGAQITVTGEFYTEEKDGRTYLKIRETGLALQGGKRDASQSDSRASGGYSAPPSGGVPDMDDEIPFAPW
jgi:single-strand DNA-binding protein